MMECILIDPYNKQVRDENCYTIRRNIAYIKDSELNVPSLWSEQNNIWRLQING